MKNKIPSKTETLIIMMDTFVRLPLTSYELIRDDLLKSFKDFFVYLSKLLFLLLLLLTFPVSFPIMYVVILIMQRKVDNKLPYNIRNHWEIKSTTLDQKM